jgi:ribosome-associated toxin RatA of RatAB toxin-antitoxin module
VLGLGAGLLVLVLALGQAGAAASDAERAFTAAEQQLLAAGKLVIRRKTQVRGNAHFIGGMSWQVIEADAATVWRTASDVTTYPRFLPAVAEARRTARLGSSERIFIRHAYSVVDASYSVLLTADPKQRVLTFRLDHSEPSAIDEAFGELRVTAIDARRSVVSFSIMVDVGSGLIARLLRAQVHEWTLRIPNQLRRHLHKQLKVPAKTPT